MNPANIPKDKLLHFFWGAIIGTPLGVLGYILIPAGVYGVVFPAIIAAAAGAHKEWKDSRGTGHVEFMDFAYTTAGGFPAAIGLAAGVLL